jgi:pimeloyl-ACP methyl ester carboxylesterase
MLGDSTSRAVSIYLPPSYNRQRSRRFPVVYLLHGFGGDNSSFIAGRLQNLNIRVSMDSLVASGKVTEMIVVTPNARNRYDGAFYTNSPVTGNWEDFIVRDLVGYVDSHYRTVRRREGRGIAGHSMGGHGALRLGMRHPETFSAIYALSPYGLSLDSAPAPATARAWMKAISLTDTSQFRKAGFNVDLLIAESAVYASDPARPPFFVDFLFRAEDGKLVLDSAVARKWQVPLSEVPRYAANLRREKIGFDAGRADGFPHIPPDVAALDRLMTGLAIPHFAELYEGTHGSRIRQRLEQVVLPFFSASFENALHLSKAASKSRTQ